MKISMIRSSLRTTLRSGIFQRNRALHTSPALLNKKIIDDDMMDKASAEFEDGTDDGSKKWEGTAKKAREESDETRKRTYRGLIATSVMVAGTLGYMSRPFDEEETKHYKDINATSFDPASLWNRVYSRITGSFQQYKEPIQEKLLPDSPSSPYGRPLTLVLGLDDLLVRHSWSREHGWRTAKRPGVDYFLGYLSQYYEVVVFSDKYSVYDQDVVQQLDPYRASISYALFREAARYDGGKIIKDLNHLNRDLSKVIVVDTVPDAVSLQPDNALLLPKWTGKKDDVDLIRLLNVLEYIATQPNVKDVRPMLKTLMNSGDALAEFERRDRAYREKQSTQKAPKLGSIMGMPGRDSNMTAQDVIRQRAQRNYAAQQKFIQEQGKKLLEEEKKMQEELGKTTLSQLITGQGAAPSQEELEAELQRRVAKRDQEEKEKAKSN